MTKNAVAANYPLHEWADGTRRSWPEPEAGEAPAWFLAQADNTWSAPVSNTLSDVAPSPSPGGVGQAGIINAWTGGYSDQLRGEFGLCANGGHGDYAGNETYAVALRDENPAWQRLNDPSSASGGATGRNSKGDYGDGRMRSVHGYNRCVFGGGKVWYAGMDGMYSDGEWSTAVWSWDRATDTFDYHGLGHTNAQRSGGNLINEGGPAAFDRVGGQVWSMGTGAAGDGSGIISVDVDSGAITRHVLSLNTLNLTGSWAVVAHDADPRVLIIGRTDGTISVVNIESPTGVTNKTPSGGSTVVGAGVGAYYLGGVVYCWHHTWGKTIRTIIVPDDPINGTYTRSALTPAAGGETPPGTVDNDFQGAYSKFQCIEDMGNGRPAFVTVCHVSGETYVYKPGD